MALKSGRVGIHPSQVDPITGMLIGGTGGASIDDASIASDTTWSSQKINTELNNKQDTLTAGSNITIENNVISSTASGGGSKITVTTTETTLKGKNVTLTQGQTTLTATFNNSGVAVFEGVTLTGTVQLSASDGTSTSTRTLTIPYFGNYEVTMAFFSATITVTYPSGATCTISDGTTTLTATSNPMAFNVPNAGTWTAKATLDGVEKSGTAISITTDGQTASDTIAFGTINLTLDSDFIGSTITCVKDQTTISKVASGTSLTFYPPTTGSWTVSGSVSGTTYVSSPNPVVVSSLSTPVSATLQTLATLTVTLYGAEEDTITFTDGSGVSKIETFASGETSKSVSMKVLPSGSSITFTSSVAKNPSDFTEDYSKTISVDSNTTEIYVMPDKTLFWWGYAAGEFYAMPVNSQVTGTYDGDTWSAVTRGRTCSFDPPSGSRHWNSEGINKAIEAESGESANYIMSVDNTTNYTLYTRTASGTGYYGYGNIGYKNFNSLTSWGIWCIRANNTSESTTDTSDVYGVNSSPHTGYLWALFIG